MIKYPLEPPEALPHQGGTRYGDSLQETIGEGLSTSYTS
jgi:hypothetical protein